MTMMVMMMMMLMMMMMMMMMMAQIEGAVAKGDKEEEADLRKEVAALDERIVDAQSSFVKEPVCAYVSFDNQETVDKFLSEYPTAWHKRIFCCGFNADNRKFMFRPQEVNSCFCNYTQANWFVCERAPDPSNIVFHNLAFDVNNRRWRLALSTLLTVIALLVSVAILTVAAYFGNQIPSDAQCPAVTPTLLQAQNTSSLMPCFCKDNVAQIYSNDDINKLCIDWLSTYSLAQGLIYGSSIVVIVVNVVLDLIVKGTTPTRCGAVLTPLLFPLPSLPPSLPPSLLL